MSDQKYVRWLNAELPKLTGAGVVPADVAERIRAHYGAGGEGGGKRGAILVFSILGGALIGAGLILLLAHNWDEFGRPTRTVLSLLPLLVAQALAAFVIWRKSESGAWREGVGVFWVLAIGASISLVAQTYHISGDLPAFLLTWTLAALPVVYLLNSSTAAMLFWVGATSWAGSLYWEAPGRGWFWVVAALAVPHLWAVARVDRYRPRVAWLLWTLGVCAAIGTGFGLDHYRGAVWVPVFTSYFAALYLIGELWWGEGRTIWQRPLQTIGALGVITLAVILTFEDYWRHWAQRKEWLLLMKSPLLVMPAVAVGLWGWAWARRNTVALLFGALPVVTVAGRFVPGGLMVVAMNLYVLGLGVALIGLGVRDRRLGVVNLGLLVVSVLIIARFFDSNMSIVVRALAFIAVGVGFLVTNIVLIKRTREAQ
ncbi:MAG: hypothetical protein PCFJNLEI_03915 [Verrucomicrobiae bacterium]|nr:hypothetical protein [Verrucomicrobiae bacterium]